MSDTIKRWVVVDFNTLRLSDGASELMAWVELLEIRGMNKNGPLREVARFIDNSIKDFKKKGYRAVEKTYREVEE